MQIFKFFLWGVFTRLWAIIPALLTDPYDLLERWFGMSIPSPQWLFVLLLGAGIVLVIFLTFRDYAKHGHIRLNPSYITDLIWDTYKQGQTVVMEKGIKGLSKAKYNEVRNDLKNELKVPDIPIKEGFVLSKAEGKILIEDITDKMSSKMKGEARFNPDTFNNLALLSRVLDENEVGLIAITKQDEKYKASEYELGKRRAGVKSQKEIRHIVNVVHILNSILLAFCYFSPSAKKVMPSNKLPPDMMRQWLDEVMLDYTKDLVDILRRRG